jgi:hypothetical protein
MELHQWFQRRSQLSDLTRMLQLSPTAQLDVMVNIHGGGFFSGTGASYLWGPQYLLDKDIVLVTFNYRLGALGQCITRPLILKLPHLFFIYLLLIYLQFLK